MPLCLVLYEDVKQNPIKEIRKVMKFIEKMSDGYKPDDLEERLLCLSENLRGGFKRNRVDQGKLYTNELKAIINSNIDYAQEALIKHGINANITLYKKKLS